MKYISDIGGGGPPEMFLITVLKRLGGGSWNLMTFNINLWSITKVILAPLVIWRYHSNEFVREYSRFSEVMYQPIPSLTIPRANLLECFWKSKFPTPRAQRKCKTLYPWGNYFQKSSKNPQNMRQKLKKKTVLKC